MYTGPRSTPIVSVALIPDGGSAPIPVDLTGRFVSLKFTDSDNKPDKMELVLRNDDLFFFDNPLLDNGQAIWLQWGYPELMVPPRMLMIKKFKSGSSKAGRQRLGDWKGDVAIKKEFNTVTVEGKGLEVEFGRAPRRRSHKGLLASEMAANIATEFGYPSTQQFIDKTAYRYGFLPQAGQTDAAFLYRLALIEGYQWYVDSAGFHFRKRDYSAPTDHVATWRTDNFGIIVGVAFDNDMSGAVGSTTTRGYDPRKRKAGAPQTSGDGVATTSPSGSTATNAFAGAAVPSEALAALANTLNAPAPGQTDVDTPVIPVDLATAFGQIVRARDASGAMQVATASEKVVAGSEEKAKRKSDARYRKSRDGLVKLRVNIVGDPTVAAKQIFELLGVGKRLSGRYRITEVEHVVQDAFNMELKLSGNSTGTGVVPTTLPQTPATGAGAAGQLAVVSISEDGKKYIALATSDGSALANDAQIADEISSGKASAKFIANVEANASPSAATLIQAAQEQQRFVAAALGVDQAAFSGVSAVRPTPPSSAFEQNSSQPIGTPAAPASGGG